MTVRFDIVGITDDTRIIGGDDKQLLLSIPNIPDGVVLKQAWFTAKRDPLDDDPGLVQKIITTDDTPGTGFIVDDGATSHSGVVRIDLSRDDTAALIVPDPYYGVGNNVYDVQVITVGGQVETSIEGDICAFRGVTSSTTVV